MKTFLVLLALISIGDNLVLGQGGDAGGNAGTPTPTPTSTPASTTSTPTSTATNAPIITNPALPPTPTPTPTSTATGTPAPTNGSTPTPTATPARTNSSTPVPTAKPPGPGPAPGPTPARTSTPTPTPAGTKSPSGTPAPSGGGGGSSGGSTSGGGGSAVPNAAGLTPSSGQSGPTDADILYFAYNLEIFYANFYSCSATGSGVPSQYLGGGPAATGCQQATLTSATATFASELAREEIAHVALLYNALKAAGVNPVAPLIDISPAVWNTAAQQARGASAISNFSPYGADLPWLNAVFLFEDTSASAYFGATNSISNSTYRLIATQIGGAEAYHASLDRTLLYQQLTAQTPYGISVQDLSTAITSLVNNLAQAPQIKYTIYNQQGSGVSDVDSNGLVPAASAQQVLRVFTLGAAAGSGGGFFPNNLNGNVKN